MYLAPPPLWDDDTDEGIVFRVADRRLPLWQRLFDLAIVLNLCVMPFVLGLLGFLLLFRWTGIDPAPGSAAAQDVARWEGMRRAEAIVAVCDWWGLVAARNIPWPRLAQVLFAAALWLLAAHWYLLAP